jgi:flavin-dependent dehydrogenase
MSSEGFDSKYDVVVVGARAAGSATAMLLARQGVRVLAIDRGHYGTDTVSTHALMRGGVLQLHRWGVLPRLRDEGAVPIRRTTFYYDREAITIPIKSREGVDALFAPRRALLDRVLVDCAAAAGAVVRHETQLLDLVRNADGRVRGVVVKDAQGRVAQIGADTVVGADGLRSVVARLAGAQTYVSGSHATGVFYGHWRGLTIEGYRWYYKPGISIGAIPTTAYETCVFVSVPATRFVETFRADVAAGLRRSVQSVAPELGETLRRASMVGQLNGFAGHVGFYRQSWGPGWALVGDAGYFKDPLTAHGITDALRDAELLSDAIVSGGSDALANYQRTRDKLSRGVFDLTDRIASFAWDMDELKRLHQELSSEMGKEVKYIADHDAQRLAMGA